MTRLFVFVFKKVKSEFSKISDVGIGAKMCKAGIKKTIRCCFQDTPKMFLSPWKTSLVLKNMLHDTVVMFDYQIFKYSSMLDAEDLKY